MMRSMFSGVAGLQAQQTAMDVIGNNIANVNTAGYKDAQVNFQDILSQTIQGASAPQGNRGGTNPMQVGLGVKVSSITTVFTPGSLQSTGVNTDLAINNDGFFVLSNGSDQVYTRAGAFIFDSAGNLVDPSTGYQVQGWMRNPTTGLIDTNAPTTSISVPKGVTMPPKVSTDQVFSGNLSAADLEGDSTQTSGKVYDSLGNAHTAYTTYYKEDSSTNTWLASVTVPELGVTNNYQLSFDSSGKFSNLVSITANAPAPQAIAKFQMDTTNTQKQEYTVFDSSGKMHVLQMTITPSSPGNSTGTPASPISWSYTITDKTDSTVSIPGGSITYDGTNYAGFPTTIADGGTTLTLTMPTGANLVAPASGQFSASAAQPFTASTTANTLNLAPLGANAMTLQLDMSALTGYQTADNAPPPTTDGYASGTLTDSSFDSSGTIVGTFDNGMSMNLGQIALATFNNPSGLTKVSDTMFSVSNNSGAANIGTSGTGGRGSISASELEQSNVDLAQEFSNMIVTERAFQANSKIITTSDEMLQTLTNLKQG